MDMVARRPTPTEWVVFAPDETIGAAAAAAAAMNSMFGKQGIGLQQGANRSKSVATAVKVGPWGGRGGTPRDISKGSSQPQRLESVTVRSTDSYGGRINGFSFVYVDQNGQSVPVGTWGSTTKGYEETIEGTVDDIGVTSLKLVTNTGVEYGTYGYPCGKAFSVQLQQRNAAALCFFGRSSDSLVALGTYVTPCA